MYEIGQDTSQLLVAKLWHRRIDEFEFIVSQSSEKLVNADFDDLLDSNGAIDGWNAEINRVPAMWIMPGNSNDEQVGFMICGEYFRSRYLGFQKFYH